MRGKVILCYVLLVGMTIGVWQPARAFDALLPSCPPSDLGEFVVSQPCSKGYEPARSFTLSPSKTGGPDTFGYAWDDSPALAWKDASAGTQVFPDPAEPDEGVDDSVTDAIDLGFSFKFYEYAYSQVIIGSNGLLGFDETIQSGNFSLRNFRTPLDAAPQNIIAGFWDDLRIGGEYNAGKVYYMKGTDARGQYFVVEWRDVSRIGSTDPLTFEVVLYENGDILLQYQDLIGDLDSATVGIEDSDGVDGLLYLYNAAGLTPGKAIEIKRPSQVARVKAFPLYQGGFNLSFQSRFQVYLRNTGEKGADAYNLKTTASAPGWTVGLYGPNGRTPLADSDQDGQVDTGSLDQRETFTATVVVRAPPDANIGAATTIDLTATSRLDPARKVTVRRATTIPAPFALAFDDSRLKVNMELDWKYAQKATRVDDWFSGSSFGFNTVTNGNYLYLWEKNDVRFIPPGTVIPYADIETVMLNKYGFVIRPTQKLTDHSGTDIQVQDLEPVTATAPNGAIGIAWVRRQLRADDLKSNYNIFLAILNSAGVKTLGPYNLTNDDHWTGEGDPDILKLGSIRIAATEDNRFHMTWVERHILGEQFSTDIFYSVYGADGAVIKTPVAATPFTPGEADEVNYSDPTPAFLSGKRILLTYNVYDSQTEDYQVVYDLLDSGGEVVQDAILLSDGHGGGRMDTVQLKDGNIVLAWKDLASEAIEFLVLKNDLSLQRPATALPNPDGRSGGFVSLTPDQAGQAVLTWMDDFWSQRLYYGLVDKDGVISPPMIFKYGQTASASLLTSYLGQGNAPYDPNWQLELPVISR